jgi:hypothetical protein
VVGDFFVVVAGATGAVAGRTVPVGGRRRGAAPLAGTGATGAAAVPEGDAPMSVGDGVWTPF